jgi:hypothetical protein
MRRITMRFLSCLLLIAVSAHAQALFPCINAVSSRSGSFLGLANLEYLEKPGYARYSLSIFRKEQFINPNDQVGVPGTYWTDAYWSVVLDNLHEYLPCQFPMITDDGEFVVLLHSGSASAEEPVLRIYRKRDHTGDPIRKGPDHGIFIKGISLREIWPSDKVTAAESWIAGGPEWFTGASFDFSADGRELIYKTRWGNTVRISLPEGVVLRE